MLRIAGPVVVIAGGAAFAVTSLAGYPESESIGLPPTADDRSVRPVGESGGAPAPAPDPRTCVWVSAIGVPFLPAENIGGPPTEGSVLVFESCDGEPTGRLAWCTGPAEDVAWCWPAR